MIRVLFIDNNSIEQFEGDATINGHLGVVMVVKLLDPKQGGPPRTLTTVIPLTSIKYLTEIKEVPEVQEVPDDERPATQL